MSFSHFRITERVFKIVGYGSPGYAALMARQLAFLGFGEAAQTFAGDSKWQAEAKGYDIKLNDPVLGPGKCAEFSALKVADHHDNDAALAGVPVVLSLVTADQAVKAAEQAAPHLSPQSLFLDMNSVAPMRKKEAADIIESAGAHYLDVAIMAPVQPAALGVPLLLSGTHAQAAEKALKSFGFADVRTVGHNVGDASTVKMIRSVMIKGIEALTAECLMAAHAAGVVSEVLSSFGEGEAERANYNLERMLVHGERRAAELEDVCATLEDLGIEPLMSKGTVAYQRSLSQQNNGNVPLALDDKLALVTPSKSGTPYAAHH